jgi:hypothetical protein
MFVGVGVGVGRVTPSVISFSCPSFVVAITSSRSQSCEGSTTGGRTGRQLEAKGGTTAFSRFCLAMFVSIVTFHVCPQPSRTQLLGSWRGHRECVSGQNFETETVGVLKDTIKDKKRPSFDHVTADSLVLWKLSIPVTDFEQRAEHITRPKDIKALEGSEKLKAVKKLSAYFESPRTSTSMLL